MRRRRHILVLAVAVLVAIYLLAQTGWVRGAEAAAEAAPAAALPATSEASQEAVALDLGELLYAEHCARCHGAAFEPVPGMGDLRLFTGDRAAFEEVVLYGYGPMPAWRGFLTEEDLAALWLFVARETRGTDGPERKKPRP